LQTGARYVTFAEPAANRRPDDRVEGKEGIGMRGRPLRLGLVALAGVVGAAVLVGVSTGAREATKGQIIIFGPTSSNNYVAQLYKGARQTAAKEGYSLKIIENNFDQSAEDNQVQQQLASGTKPVAYGWWPSDNKAGIGSQRALANSGVPVFMVNQLPIKGTEKYWVAYAGVNDVFNGYVSGQSLIKARNALVASGHKLHSKGGNAIEVGFPAGYSAGADRDKGLKQALKGSGIKIIASQPAGFDPAAGYKIGSQLITANKSKGIDLVYAQNSALADGVIQALTEQGFKPGVDVEVVGGTCHGNIKPLVAGQEFATGLQAARLEGVYMLAAMSRYLVTKKVVPGVLQSAPLPNRIPPIVTVHRYNFIPNPPVFKSNVGKIRLWGYSVRQLCTY
jgi:ABC-type sugar transport system substrate-binding protein